MILATHTKQPAETLDYDVDFTDWMTSGDTLESATVVVEPAGLDLLSNFVTSPYVKVWLAGGALNATYKVTVTVTTADGRIKQDEFRVKIKET